ncbi:MAG: TetR/AcrR family transcriptional regulator [Pseudomonas sp.]|nr:TetR/AcrR family transcriptional regulator [Pseudomonas sp.]
MAYRTTATRIDRDLALRERILEQALVRVIAGGFAALTMQALADAVGIATGSLYRHFSNKGELAAEVFARASQREVDALAATLNAPGTPSQRLAAGVQQFAARAWHSRRLAYALIAEPVEPQVDEQRLIYRRAYAELFGDLLEEGMRSGQFARQPAALTAACLVGAIAEALVGPLAPAAQSPQPDPQQLAAVSLALRHFCLRAVAVDLPPLES